jgi:hypothetical protein
MFEIGAAPTKGNGGREKSADDESSEIAYKLEGLSMARKVDELTCLRRDGSRRKEEK